MTAQMPEQAHLRELIGDAASYQKVQVPYAAATVVGLFVHASLLVIFTVLGVWPMALFNIGSVAVFIAVRIFFQRGRMGTGMVLAITEVVVHQVLAVYFCGWSPGFQYYLLSVAPLTLMLPGIRPKVGYFFAAIPLLTFVTLATLDALTARVAPYAFPEPLGRFIGFFNELFSFAVLWVFVAFYRHGAELAEVALASVVERSERLLYGILPPAIVERLREKPGVVADAFDEVTVLFADLVGFTPLAQRMSPDALVVLLDGIFASFDDLVTSRGLEKIKTIGDAYMVAGGVPAARADHAAAMADLSLALRDALAAHAARVGEPLAIRIGMHTGPVVAGVIGKSKFAYDLWGDAVNTAARMESHGEPGKIHITEATVAALGDAWVVEERGSIEVKGKGAMRTFWLIGPRAQAREGTPRASDERSERAVSGGA